MGFIRIAVVGVVVVVVVVVVIVVVVVVAIAVAVHLEYASDNNHYHYQECLTSERNIDVAMADNTAFKQFGPGYIRVTWNI